MNRFPLNDVPPGEKLWLLAGELLRDCGQEEVNAHNLATVLGQALACVAVYSTPDPLDPRTPFLVMNCAEDAALAAQEQFLQQVRRLAAAERAGLRRSDTGVAE